MNKLRPGVILFLIIGLAVAAGINWLSEWASPRVADNQEAAMNAFLQRMIPQDTTETGYSTESFVLLAPNYLKMGDVQTATRVLENDTPTQVIYRALSDRAYNDRIGVMASFDDECTITHVEIISHKETPGLGDQFKNNDNAWLNLLVGKTTDTRWALKPEGDIDTWTGATVTPMAIVDTLYRMQQLCTDKYDSLFSNEGILYLEVGNPENPQP